MIVKGTTPAYSKRAEQVSSDSGSDFKGKKVSDNKDSEVSSTTSPPPISGANKGLRGRSVEHSTPQTTNREALIAHLEKANSERLNDYIDAASETAAGTSDAQSIAANLKKPLKSLVEYNKRLDGELKRINELGQKLQDRGLDESESLEMKALMRCNQYNLSRVQAWLAATQALSVEADTMNEPTANLFVALSNRIAMRHMNLADMISLYEDRLTDDEPISRNDRIGYNLLTARTSLRAFKTMALSQRTTDKDAFEKMKAIYPSLVRHCKELEHALRLTRGQGKMDPTNPQLELESLDAWLESFDLVSNKASTEAVSQRTVDELNKQWDKDSSTLPLSHHELSQRDMTGLFIEHQLKKVGVDMTRLPKFEAAYKAALVTEINQGEWPIIDKSLRFEMGGKKYQCSSRITPGAHLARFQKTYESNGVGYMDRLQTEHAPNMAHTQLLSEDDEILFSGVRHGIIDSYDYNEKKVRTLSDAQLTKMATAIYDDSPKDGVVSKEQHIQDIVYQIKNNPTQRAYYIARMRNVTSRKMARELLSAAIVSDPAKLKAAMQGDTVDVTLNSIALVTPDWLRARYMTGSDKDERLMLEHQVHALQSLDTSRSPDTPVKLMITDENGEPKEVKVNVKVRTFNFGVNDYALAKTVLPSEFPLWRSLMGWGFSADLNNPQLRELLGPSGRKELGGAVAEKLQQLEQSTNPKEREKAVLLKEAASQAKIIWRKRSFWSGNNEPYKMVSRLALISHLMGETTLFNCKSGKDRTGQLDAEVKYLAAVGHASGHIPEPDAAHTAESRKMRTAFTLDAGNMELQRMNTGLPGYKLRNIPGLESMLEEGVVDVYEGGSDYV